MNSTGSISWENNLDLPIVIPTKCKKCKLPDPMAEANQANVSMPREKVKMVKPLYRSSPDDGRRPGQLPVGREK
jgi:hypothetical protein